MLLAAIILVQSYVAAPFPQWDVDGLCGTMPPYAAKACVEREQSSYADLKEEWVRLTDAQRNRVKALGDQARNYRYTVAHNLATNLIAIEEAKKPVQVPRFQQ